MLELSKSLGLKKGVHEPGVFKTGDIYMRDPFLFTDKKRKLYFLFGTNPDICDGAANIDPYFEVYVSQDRQNFEGPLSHSSLKKGSGEQKITGRRKCMNIKAAIICLQLLKAELVKTEARRF